MGDEFRLVHFNTPRVSEHKFVGNAITTSLYQVWNFIPKLFYEEFRKLANLHFAFVSVLQILPSTSNTNGTPTSLPALVLVVVFSSFMKLNEDRGRHAADKTANKSTTRRLRDGVFEETAWSEVVVGDLLKVENREGVPADMLICAVHEPDPTHPRGECHVETKSLDGETNLKGRSVPRCLLEALGGTLEEQSQHWGTVKGMVELEKPNAATTKLTAKLLLEGAAEPAVISISNVLLRGSTVRNSEYVLGLVLNTGTDTKVMQGATKPPLKESTIGNTVNWIIVGMYVVLFSMCTLNAALEAAVYPSLKEHWYVTDEEGEPPRTPFFTNIFYYFVLLSAFLSVSLYPSIHFVRGVQAYMMTQSLAMYHEESDTPMNVKTLSLTDELGVITHVFSDKTGTLTKNVMQFRKCSIAGVSYGHGHTEIGRARMTRLGLTDDEDTADADAGAGAGTSSATEEGSGSIYVNFSGAELPQALEGRSGAEQQAACRDFFLHLALCHTVVMERLSGESKMSASSPDEQALVAGAAHFGFHFLDREHDTVVVRDEHAEKELRFTLLATLAFSSARKRMSVVMRDESDGTLLLLSKGADNVMLKLLAPGQEALMRTTEDHMEEHSNEGLRTLVVARKSLDAASFATWDAQFRAATSDLAEIEKKDAEAPNEIDRLMGELEADMQLLGSTALEDKLQEAVPKTIADMGRGGIVVWVLTGDKEETAINIAFACRLLDLKTEVRIIGAKTHTTTAAVIAALNAPPTESGKTKLALVLDGDIISMIMASSEAQLALLKMTQLCHSVVACRCAPSQKATLVKLVRRNVQNATTLAIGDGANDVAMIQAAHVGVGISGHEGMQAANSADFSIAQFRFLGDMLFVHGRHCYRRVATLITYITYKNVMLTLATYWYSFFTYTSGQKFMMEGATQTFNVIWTAIPILIVAIFDKDVSDVASRALPQLYNLGTRNVYYSLCTIGRWAIDAMLESVLVVLLLLYSLDKLDHDGGSPSVYYLGAYAFTNVLFIVSLKLGLWMWQYTWYQWIPIFFCVIFWFPTCLVASLETWISNSFLAAMVYGWVGLWQNFSANPAFWLLILLTTSAALLPQLYLVNWRRTFYPEFRDLAMEAEVGHLALDHLEGWEIPPAMRRRALKKQAPIAERKSVWKMLPCSKFSDSC